MRHRDGWVKFGQTTVCELEVTSSARHDTPAFFPGRTNCLFFRQTNIVHNVRFLERREPRMGLVVNCDSY